MDGIEAASPYPEARLALLRLPLGERERRGFEVQFESNQKKFERDAVVLLFNQLKHECAFNTRGVDPMCSTCTLVNLMSTTHTGVHHTNTVNLMSTHTRVHHTNTVNLMSTHTGVHYTNTVNLHLSALPWRSVAPTPAHS